MITGLSLPAALAPAPAIPTAAPTTAGAPGFAQALHAADQPAPVTQTGPAATSPGQWPPDAPSADAPPEPVPEIPTVHSSDSPLAERTTRAPRWLPLSRPPIDTTVHEGARAPAGTDTKSRSPGAAVSREEDPRVPIASHDAPPSLQALLAALQPPSDAAPAAAWGAPACALPVTPSTGATPSPAPALPVTPSTSATPLPATSLPVPPFASATPAPSPAWPVTPYASATPSPAPASPVTPCTSAPLLPAPVVVRGVVRLEPESAVANPAVPVISGEEAGVATRGPAAATPTNEASPTGLPPTITNETIAPGPSAPSSPLIQASATQAAPATASASLPPAVQAQIAASPHSAAFGPELGAQISTFVRHGVERAQLQLHPAEMGPVTVQILVEGASAQVRLWAEQPGTRQALEQAMPALAGQLREGGLTLTGGGVFEQPRQAPEQTWRETGAGVPAAAHPTADPAALSFAAPTRRRGLVDLVA